MKRKYETPLCEAHRLETAGGLLAASETRNLTVDHTPSDTPTTAATRMMTTHTDAE